MDNLERDIRRMGETPPSQIFWHNQATSQRQYHSPLPEQVSFARQQDVYSNYHSDSNAGFWNACIYGFGLTQNTPPDDCSSLSSLGWSSQHSTVDSYGSRNTSYSHPGTTGSGSIDPRLIKGGSPPENSCQIPLTGIPLVASPNGLAAATSSPILLHCQSGSAAQAAVWTTHLSSGYLAHNPNYSRYPVEQEQQPASGPQYQEPYLNLNTSGLVPSLPLPLPRHPPTPPPHRPTHHGEEGGAIADHPIPSHNVCWCGAVFGRRTDMERHQRTTRKHNKGRHGRACPVEGCRFTSNFTRNDNLSAHCKRLHRMSADEVKAYIREGGDRRSPRFLVGLGSRVAIW